MSRKKWSKDEIQFLKDNRGKKTHKEIGKILERSAGSLSGISSILGLTSLRGEFRKWSIEEDVYLKDNYFKLPARKIAQHLKRTRSSIVQYAFRIGLSHPRSRKLDSAEVKRLYDSGFSPAEIGKRLGVSDHTIRERLKQSGINFRSRAEAIKLQYKRSGRKSAMFGLTGPDCPNWKGGKTISHGYALIHAPNHPRAVKGYVREHILVWEKHHGRMLPDGWIIHHMNGKSLDNHPENLLAMPNKKHSRLIPELNARIRFLENQIAQLKN